MVNRNSWLSFAFATFIFLLPLGLVSGAVEAAPKPVQLKFAHHNPPKGRTTVKFLDAWMKMAEEATQGKIKFISYPAQSLAQTPELVAAIEGGIADMGWASTGNFPGRFPLTEVLTLPFLVTPLAEKNSRVMQKLYEKFPSIQNEYANTKVIFLHSSEPYFLMTTNRKVRTMEDLKGLKIKVLGHYPSESIKLLGATPVNIPMPGLYEAAEKGVLDGTTLPWAAADTFRLNEVFRYYTDVATWPSTFFVMMNKRKWESLPPDVQKALMSVGGIKGAEFAARSAFGPDLADEMDKKMKASGKIMERVELAPGEFERWKKTAGEPVWNAWVEQMKKKGLPGRKILDEAIRLLAAE